jgi:hypothetical protein
VNLMHQRMLVATAVAVMIASPHHASADPKAAAQQHIDRASKLHVQGEFAQALDELKTAFSLDPRPELLYAMGQLHVGLGQCPQAITYYQRYLATKPAPSTANAATEAIDACKTNPPPAIDRPPVEEPPPDEPAAPPVAPPKPVTTAVTSRPWYGDYIADGLVGAGVIVGIVGIVQYRSAAADRDRADAATDYQSYVDLIDSAHSARTTAVVLGAVGVAAIAGGFLHYVLTDRDANSGVAIIPSQDGGFVAWTGQFR